MLGSIELYLSSSVRLLHFPLDPSAMMRVAVLTISSLVFLAAHAMRIGSPGGVAFWLLAAFLVLRPAPWKGWALAGIFGFALLFWGDITLNLVQYRIAHGLPWLRPALILGAIILLSLAALCVNYRYASEKRVPGSLVQAMTFLLTVAGLALIREKAPLDILLFDRFYPGGGWVAIILLGYYAAWIAGKLMQSGSSKKWRLIIWLFFSVLFFAQLLLGLLGFERLLMTGNLHLPIPALIAAGPLYRGEGFFMIILFAVTLVLVGPAWCSHLCYFGVWDNLAAAARKRAGVLPTWAGKGRWLICFVVLAAAVALGRSGLPVSLAIILAAVFGLGGVAVMFFWSRRNGSMIHCSLYCPMGLIANVFGRINPWRIRIDRECCKCYICTRYCRYGALTPDTIAGNRVGGSCSLCGDCINSCPHGHLHYFFPGLSSAVARSVFIVMVVTLHAIFLGVARL